jgi:pyruvate dehydrogenase complex dehydrogenase (E1) component
MILVISTIREPHAPEIEYMLERRRALGGFLPERRNNPRHGLVHSDGQDLQPARAAHYPQSIGRFSLAYKESEHGQQLHVGINEAGRLRPLRGRNQLCDAWRADDSGLHLLFDVRLPAHRRLDLAAMDQMSRGFIIGATAGRTTLTGEGLQHADGYSPVMGATNPATKIYDRRTPTRSPISSRQGWSRCSGQAATTRTSCTT